MNEQKNSLTPREEMVWFSLTSLDDGERITGPRIRERTGINERNLFGEVRSTRRKRHLIGSSKKEGRKGYFEVRHYEDGLETLQEMRAAIKDQTKTADIFEDALNEKFGKGAYASTDQLKEG